MYFSETVKKLITLQQSLWTIHGNELFHTEVQMYYILIVRFKYIYMHIYYIHEHKNVFMTYGHEN